LNKLSRSIGKFESSLMGTLIILLNYCKKAQLKYHRCLINWISVLPTE
jgi:hypothetical protein